MKTSMTIDNFLEDIIRGVIEQIEELGEDKSSEARWQRLAYVECLEIIKSELGEDAGNFGLAEDLDKKYIK